MYVTAIILLKLLHRSYDLINVTLVSRLSDLLALGSQYLLRRYQAHMHVDVMIKCMISSEQVA